MGNSPSTFTFFQGDHVTRKTTERAESKELNLRLAVSGMKGLRNTMEDRHICAFGIPVRSSIERPMESSSRGNNNNSINSETVELLSDHGIFAVFDGHGGDFTSTFLQHRFMVVFSRRPELAQYAAMSKVGPKSRADVMGICLLKQALAKAFRDLDDDLYPLQKIRNQAIQEGKLAPPIVAESDSEDDAHLVPRQIPRKRRVYSPLSRQRRNGAERSGSTAVVVLLTPTQIICANTGDSRAVLRRYGRALPLSFDHKPYDLPERIRVVDAGGSVKMKRIDGDLAVSRAFGDFYYKENQAIPYSRQKVIVDPDIITYPRDEQGDEFIVLACDGIWDVTDNKQCTDFVQLLLSEGELDLGNICEEVMDTCLERNSRDNMTMMLIALPALKADTSGRAVMNNAVWGHRASRQARQWTNQTMDVTTSACARLATDVVVM